MNMPSLEKKIIRPPSNLSHEFFQWFNTFDVFGYGSKNYQWPRNRFQHNKSFIGLESPTLFHVALSKASSIESNRYRTIDMETLDTQQYFVNCISTPVVEVLNLTLFYFEIRL